MLKVGKYLDKDGDILTISRIERDDVTISWSSWEELSPCAFPIKRIENEIKREGYKRIDFKTYTKCLK